MTGCARRTLISIACLIVGTVSVEAVAQQRPDTALYYVANTRPPDAYLALRTEPTAARGARIMTMPNGTALRILERRTDGWWRVRVEPSGQEGWAMAYQGNRTWIDCCVTATVAKPVAAEQSDGFKSPSGNIHCQSFESDPGSGQAGRSLRCDIRSITNRLPSRPRDCDLDWGQAFEVDTSAKSAERICHGDTVMDDKLRPLAYGQTWQRDGLNCKSEPSGVTCINPQGHGFELSKGSQRLF